MPDFAKKYYIPALFSVILTAGFLIGSVIGTGLQKRYFSDGNPILYLFTETVGEYAYIQAKLRSENELDRMIAYYALLEYGKLDSSFLIDRFENEKSHNIRRLIVWMMGQTVKITEVEEYIRKKYKVSNQGIKIEMKKTMERHNASLGK